MTKSEKKAKLILESKGYKVYRDGYPDFLTITSDNKLEWIEVKSGLDKISKKQRKIFSILSKFGFNVFIYYDGEKIDWEKFRYCKPKAYKEKRREQQKDWRKRNPEKVKKGKKKWYQRHKKERREYAKKWREKNPDYNKEYYKKHKDKFREYLRTFRNKNK